MNIICSLWFIHSSHTFAQLLIYTRFTASEITWCTSWVILFIWQNDIWQLPICWGLQRMLLVMHFKVPSEPLVIPTLTLTMVRQCQFHYLGEALQSLTSNRLMIVMKVCVCVSSSFFNTNNFKAFKILWIISRFGSLARMQYNAAFVVCFARFFSESLHAVKPVAVEAFSLHFILGITRMAWGTDLYQTETTIIINQMDLWTGCRPKIAWPCFQRCRIYKNMCRSLGGEPNVLQNFNQNLCHYQLRISQKTERGFESFLLLTIIIFTCIHIHSRRAEWARYICIYLYIV